MYCQFYGLRELPFELTPNPRFLFMTVRHREALSNLQFGLATGKPLTLLIGEAGTGKTTLLKAALESEECRHIRTIYVSNPALKRDEFVTLLARNFELSPEAAASKTIMLSELEAVLLESRRQGEVTALVVDEAQSLSDELLEEIRLLANMETSDQKLLSLVLAGQPELATRLNQTHLRQLKQRVSLRCEIEPLDLPQAAAYVASRIRAAGGEPLKLFTREAIGLIHERSRGVPRTISVICDNTLLSGFALGVQPITRSIVAEVCRDFDFGAGDAERSIGPTAMPESRAGHEEAAPAPTADPGAPPATTSTTGNDDESTDHRLFGTIGGKRRLFSLFGR